MIAPLNLIVACTENRVIGREGWRPWKIPEDLKFFHDATAGQVVVMGRICYQTWPQAGKGGRRPVVITSQPQLLVGSTHHAEPSTTPLTSRSLDSAIAIAEIASAENHCGIFICGGQRIYEETLHLKRPLRLYLTLIHAEIPGDRYFPEWRNGGWKEIERRDSSDENYRYTFLTFERAR